MGYVWRLSISENGHIENSCKRIIIFSTHSYILRFSEEIYTCVCLMRLPIFAYNITGFVLRSVDLTNVLKHLIVPSNCSDTFLCVAANSINTGSTLNLFPCTSMLSNLITRNSMTGSIRSIQLRLPALTEQDVTSR